MYKSGFSGDLLQILKLKNSKVPSRIPVKNYGQPIKKKISPIDFYNFNEIF